MKGSTNVVEVICGGPKVVKGQGLKKLLLLFQGQGCHLNTSPFLPRFIFLAFSTSALLFSN